MRGKYSTDKSISYVNVLGSYSKLALNIILITGTQKTHMSVTLENSGNSSLPYARCGKNCYNNGSTSLVCSRYNGATSATGYFISIRPFLY